MEIAYKAGSRLVGQSYCTTKWIFIPLKISLPESNFVERVNKRFQVVNIAQPRSRFVFASRPGNIAIDNEAHAGYCFAI